MEGAYRFIRNDNTSAEDIDEAGFSATVNQVHRYSLFLGIENIATLIYNIQADLVQGNRHQGLDREADIYDYLVYKITNQQRLIHSQCRRDKK